MIVTAMVVTSWRLLFGFYGILCRSVVMGTMIVLRSGFLICFFSSCLGYLFLVSGLRWCPWCCASLSTVNKSAISPINMYAFIICDLVMGTVVFFQLVIIVREWGQKTC